ncbi:MAG: hypothetical protein J7K75_06315 [Desulfuromonas sp.]|nr:hypothetical protein [Desulfuromonas sp.]
MDAATHSRFTQQLCHWATTYIAQGRSPFRKTEPGNALFTPFGQQTPDLVFWINQDSFVAGGFVLFPDSENGDLDVAQACAHALGVNYFALWSAKTLTIWQADTLSTIKHWDLPQESTDTTIDKFEALLVQLMDEFRTLAVLGACPPENLSFWHLANLCIATYNKALPTLSEHLRRTRSQELKTIDAATAVASDKLTLSIARLLLLLYYDKLPYNIQPEKLDHALQYLSSELPQVLFDCLQSITDEPELDDRSAVLFHHLLRRLDQIAIFTDSCRAADVIWQLLKVKPPCPATQTEAELRSAPAALIYSNQIPENDPQLIEVDQPQRLALKHLLRQLKHWPQGQQHCDQVFNITAPLISDRVIAHLYNETRPVASYRNTWQAQLKVAWPGQRIELPRSTPTWTYELCYLLGIAAPESILQLSLPVAAVQETTGRMLFSLLAGSLTITEISLRSEQTLVLTMVKQDNPEQIVVINGNEKRQLAWDTLLSHGPEWLAITLQASNDLLHLIDEHQLTFDHSPETEQSQGLAYYDQSTLAAQLQYFLGGDKSSLKKNDKTGPLPLPSPAVLDALSALPLEGLDAAEQQATIDRELQRLLSITINDLSCEATKNKAATPRTEKVDKKALEEKIIHAIDTEGLPLFPTHYLYDFFRPTTSHYSSDQLPWLIVNEFMGTFTLKNASDVELEITNEYLAHAIALASYGQQALELPDDIEICRQITVRYLADLQQIRDLIGRECHASLPTSSGANRLTSKIWKSLPLPPWNLVENYILRFQSNSCLNNEI